MIRNVVFVIIVLMGQMELEGTIVPPVVPEAVDARHQSVWETTVGYVRSMIGRVCVQLEHFSFVLDRIILKDDLPNFHQVSESVYRGGQPTGGGFSELEEKGVKTVINLRAVNTDQKEMAKTGMEYHHIPISPHRPKKEDIMAFLDVVLEEANHPIYLHCFHGSDRTGLFAAVYRIIGEGWSKEEAIHEMTEGGFGFHHWLQKNLIHFLDRLDIDEIRRVATLP